MVIQPTTWICWPCSGLHTEKYRQFKKTVLIKGSCSNPGELRHLWFSLYIICYVKVESTSGLDSYHPLPHLHTFLPSHLPSFTPSFLHTFTPPHLHTFTPSFLHLNCPQLLTSTVLISQPQCLNTALLSIHQTSPIPKE